MLVLTRKEGQKIVITTGEQTIYIRVLEVINDRVRIGVDAPREIAIHREEVAQRIAQEKSKLACVTAELDP